MNMESESKRQAIYDLIEQVGEIDVLMELIKWMSADDIVAFVEDFTRLHNITIPGYEEYDICFDCQETHDVNDEHTCQEQPKYVSSIVVPC